MKSKRQRAYLHVNHPKVAAEFERATVPSGSRGKGAKLPERVKPKKGSRSR